MIATNRIRIDDASRVQVWADASGVASAAAVDLAPLGADDQVGEVNLCPVATCP